MARTEKVADLGKPMYAQLEGFESVEFIVDEAQNLYGSVSVWASREAAKTADAASRPQLTAAIGEIAEGPIERQIFEVYETKS